MTRVGRNSPADFALQEPSATRRAVSLACQPSRPTGSHVVSLSLNNVFRPTFTRYASRLRNSQVAKLSVKTAIMAIGQVLFRISRGGISLRNTPLVTTIMYRRGLA